MKNKKNVLIIVPAYNEEDNLRVFFEETNKIIQNLEDYIWEFLFIDDGSDDSTWKIIDEISNFHKSVSIKGVRLSRNFGKELALTAGILESAEEFNAVIIMDADLQHPPSAIPQLVQQWELGYQVVTAQRKQ